MSTPALLLDYLFARTLIQARLGDQVAELAASGAVQGVEEFAQALERSISAPTAYVLWEGDLFPTGDSSSAAGGKSQIVTQQWSVLLAVRNAAQAERDARNASAGPLLSSIHKALAGWTPEGAFRPMRRLPGRRANFSPNVGLYPLTFGLTLTL